jgi:hypothetical protein
VFGLCPRYSFYDLHGHLPWLRLATREKNNQFNFHLAKQPPATFPAAAFVPWAQFSRLCSLTLATTTLAVAASRSFSIPFCEFPSFS